MMMNLRTYLLGIGTGLVLAAIIVSVIPEQPAAKAGSDLAAPQAGEKGQEEISGNNDSDMNKDLTQGSDQAPNQDLNKESTPSGVISPSQEPEGTPEEPAELGDSGDSAAQTFAVLEGSTATEIAADLLALGLIDTEADFLERVGELGVAGSFQAGTFNVDKGMSIDEIITELISK